MKRLLLIILAAGAVGAVFAARPKGPDPSTSYAWTLLPPLGLREPATIDTLYENYSRQSVPSEVSEAWVTTGNLGAPGENMIRLNRKRLGDFMFADVLSAWLPQSDGQKFYNTRQPMTLLSYNASGGRENAQERLRAVFSGNANRRTQVGAMLDYIYSKGSYAQQAVKDMIWGFNGSYIGERFEFQGFYNHWNALNKENGGITDELYITDPAKLQGGVSSIDAKSIPVNLNDAHSRVVGGELLLNSRYKVGHWHTEMVDTVETRTYVPVSSFVWTLNYRHGRHSFVDRTASETSKFFEHTYLNPDETYDKTTYYTLTNTVGVSMLEGFSRWAKFGLSAFVTHQLRHYTQTPDTITHEEGTVSPFPEGFGGVVPRVTQNLAWAGGQLTKQHGSLLTYEATARVGILGDAAGDLLIDGHAGTRFRMLGDSVSIRAYGSFENVHAPYLMNNYLSNHFVWCNDFGKERTLRVGGILDVPHTWSQVNVGVENVQNHIYFNEEFLPVQHGGSVQIFSVRWKQGLHLRAFNWENTVTYQTSGDDSVIPLPKLAVYSNMYALFRIATLHVQLGIDCDYYTRYYAPAYQPATMSFAHQRKQKVGNYPFINLYANMRLGRARFYVMMSHINQGMTGKNYFVMPNYPLNPRRFQIGISVDFAN